MIYEGLKVLFSKASKSKWLGVGIGTVGTAAIQNSGVVFFVIVGLILSLVTGGSLSYGILFERLFPTAPQTQLAMFHTIFYVLTVLMILPLTGILIRIVTALVPEVVKVEKPVEKTEKERLY